MIPWIDIETGAEVNVFGDYVYGFIYRITYSNGTMYIGKKSVKSYIKKPLTKKELALVTDKRMKKYKMIEKESNWRTYNGSCKSEAIKKLDIVSKEIIHICNTKLDLSYWETFYLMGVNVLFDEKYHNSNVGGLYYCGKITDSKEYK